MYANNGGKVIRAHLIECDSLRCMLYIFFIFRLVIIPFCYSDVTYILISEFFLNSNVL